MTDYLESIPSEAREDIAKLVALIVETAHDYGPERWGTTPHSTSIRVNVGWTEILTARHEFLRLLVDGEMASSTALPAAAQLYEGEDERGYYPSVPGSLLAEIEYRPLAQLRRALAVLEPALRESVRVSARRRAGRGVRLGHSQKLVAFISGRLGIELPNPGFQNSAADEISSGSDLMEGALKRVVNSTYERNNAARSACLEHHGVRCLVCGFSFEEVYGILGAKFIHVHHVTPVAHRGGNYRINPIADLIPVCPNCHAMLHRDDPPLTVEGLRMSLVRRADAL